MAAHLAPTETVVAGRREAVRALVERLEADRVRCRLIRIDAASHSPLVGEALPELRAKLAALTPQPPTRTWLSTVDRTDKPPTADAEYWVRNLRQPVRFTEVVSELAGRGTCTLVEIGPHSVLGSSIRATLRAGGMDDALVVSTGARGTSERVSLLAALGALYCKGFNLDPTRMLS